MRTRGAILATRSDDTAFRVAEVASAVLDACDVIVAADADITDADLKTALLARWPAGGVRTFSRDFRGLANGASVACASEE